MLLPSIVPAPVPAIIQIIPHESKVTSELPERGCADCKREVRESEQIWRRHKVYIPKLIDVQVPNSNRIGKAWI